MQFIIWYVGLLLFTGFEEEESTLGVLRDRSEALKCMSKETVIAKLQY